MTVRPHGFSPFDLPSVDYSNFVLAKEGNHAVALVPVSPLGYRYALLYFQPVTGRYVLRGQDAKRKPVLDLLWRMECAHASAVGWPDDPRFGLQLHRLISGPSYPDDASRLSAAGAAALPHFLEWGR